MTELSPEIQAAVDAAKEAGHNVFMADIAGGKFYYRSISRTEFRNLQSSMAEQTEKLRTSLSEEAFEAKLPDIRDSNEDQLVAAGMVWPKVETSAELSSVTKVAGAVATLSDLIMQASGFGAEIEPVQL